MKTTHIQAIGFFLAAFISLTGCSTVPITQNIINDVGGTDEIGRFQYYVSTRLILKDTEKVRDQQDITKLGKATITDTVYKKKIIIGKNTMGVMLKHDQDDSGNLTMEICFEEDDNKRIIFRKDGPGADRKFHLVYQDPFSRTINYGGEIYMIDYSGDSPYLKVKLNKQLKQKTAIRRAKGRRVQN